MTPRPRHPSAAAALGARQGTPARLPRWGPRQLAFAEEERMKRSLGVFAVLIALGLARPVAAQVQTGSILVRAADQQGAMMPGVTITISSPVLVAGTMT